MKKTVLLLLVAAAFVAVANSSQAATKRTGVFNAPAAPLTGGQPVTTPI